jgi:hypothetical protein
LGDAEFAFCGIASKEGYCRSKNAVVRNTPQAVI